MKTFKQFSLKCYKSMKYCEIYRSITFWFTKILQNLQNCYRKSKYENVCYKVWKQYEVIHEIVAKVWNIQYESVKKSMKIVTKR